MQKSCFPSTATQNKANREIDEALPWMCHLFLLGEVWPVLAQQRHRNPWAGPSNAAGYSGAGHILCSNICTLQGLLLFPLSFPFPLFKESFFWEITYFKALLKSWFYWQQWRMKWFFHYRQFFSLSSDLSINVELSLWMQVSANEGWMKKN